MNRFILNYLGIFFLLLSILSFFNIIYSYYFNLYLNINTYFYTLLISLKEIIKIDVFNTEKSKEIDSFSILPLMGVCLSEKTNVNLNFLKNCFYVEIIFEDKLKSVENVKKDTI